MCVWIIVSNINYLCTLCFAIEVLFLMGLRSLCGTSLCVLCSVCVCVCTAAVCVCMYSSRKKYLNIFTTIIVYICFAYYICIFMYVLYILTFLQLLYLRAPIIYFECVNVLSVVVWYSISPINCVEWMGLWNWIETNNQSLCGTHKTHTQTKHTNTRHSITTIIIIIIIITQHICAV